MDTTLNEARPGDEQMTPDARTARPSVGTLLSELWRETTTLAREEAELAKVEMSEKADQAASGIAIVAAGGAVIFAGFIVLLLAATNALMPMLPPDLAAWLAPSIVGGLVMLLGFIALVSGRASLKAKRLSPSRTWRSLRRDGRIIKEHVK